MQNRMKTHPLSQDAIIDLLNRSAVGRIATTDEAGYPYVLPIHFIHWNDQIWFHGLPLGDKLDGIRRDPRIGFEVDEMMGLLDQDMTSPCNVNTVYESVIIKGQASLVTDLEVKAAVLQRIIAKYTPHLSELAVPPGMVRGTAVVAIRIDQCTGKYYK